MVENILYEEKQLQFCDEDVLQLRIEYSIFQYIKVQIINPLSNRTYEAGLVCYLKDKISKLHPSFTSSETDTYKVKIE
jgi:hypothetical protein